MCLLNVQIKTDADENVDADRVRTGRPVASEQSVDLFTQREEIDIDFRVSGLPHAVVKQAERTFPSSGARQEDGESSSSTSTSSAKQFRKFEE